MKTEIINQIDFPCTVKGDYVRCYNQTDTTVYLPDAPIGTTISIEQSGPGVITIGSQAERVNSFGNGFRTAGRYAVVQAVKVAEGVWTLIGGTL